ncbi:hypothetical protein ACFWU5_17340 [Nocardia sp. NPDC058640]|uniref:SLAC1 family transporter n=1 Tax=Nocardia sp. NPDC058640 TaxID=3346571 RepID=UPI00365963AE
MTDNKIDLSALPVPLFGPAMGIQGLALVLLESWEVLRPVSVTLSAISLMILSVVALFQIIRSFVYPSEVSGDIRSPATVSFYAQPAVTVLLAAEVFAQWHTAGVLLTALGVALAVPAAIAAMIANTGSDLPGAVPVQLIPWIAVLMIPITAHTHIGVVWSWTALGFAAAGLAQVYFKTASSLNPVAAPLIPTTTIHLAVPSVVCVDLAVLSPENPLVDVSLGAAVFVFVSRLVRLRSLASCPFGLSWWALAMPFSALVLAAAVVAAPQSGWWALVWVGAGINVVIVAWVGYRTIVALMTATLIPTRTSVPRPPERTQPIGAPTEMSTHR